MICTLCVFQYFVILLLIFILCLVGFILGIIFHSQIGEHVRNEMRETLRQDYGVNLDDDYNQGVTHAWDKMQSEVGGQDLINLYLVISTNCAGPGLVVDHRGLSTNNPIACLSSVLFVSSSHGYWQLLEPNDRERSFDTEIKIILFSVK